jgi:hypothetical protein
VTPVLVALGVVVAAGAVVAVSAREPRFAVLGILVALVASAYVAEPLPGTVALGARLVGAVLGGYLLWISLRRSPAPTAGSQLGWPGAAAIAVTAFAAGWLAGDAVGGAFAAVPGDGPTTGITAAALVAGSPVARAGLGASFALVALAAGPVIVGRDVLRLGIGLLLVVIATELLRSALVGRADDLVELAFGLLIALASAAVAAATRRSLRIHADLELRSQSARETAVRTRTVDEAHPLRTGR